MGLWQRIFRAEEELAPTRRVSRKLTQRQIEALPLTLQMRRIGGGMTPSMVTAYIREADAGRPYHLIDLANEVRQKDLHVQAILSAREDGLSSLDRALVPPSDPTPQEKDAHKFVVDSLEALDANAGAAPGALSIGELYEHSQAANYLSFSCAEAQWVRSGRLVAPGALWPISHRRFQFRDIDGELVQKDEFEPGEGRHLLRDFAPGKFIQHQPRITGDIQSREGLMRALMWAALFRNWTQKDWMLLAELAWKPWRKGQYKKSASDPEIAEFMDALEQMSSSSILVHSTDTDVEVLPAIKGSGTSSHKELIVHMGREMSKAVLGAPDVIEEGENGSRAATQTRNARFTEKIAADGKRVDRTVSAQLITPMVRMNFPPNVRPPRIESLTKDVVDLKDFSGAVLNLQTARVPVSKEWVYDKLGGGKPKDEEDTIEIPIDETTGLPSEPSGSAE